MKQTMTTTSKETWAYLRISTEGQEEGNGLDVQRQHIAAYAAATGVSVDRWLCDVQSGAKEEREGLGELREGVATGTVGTVLVYRLDRLARDAYLAEGLYRELSAKATITSVTESIGDGITGTLMRQIIQAFAEYERAVIAARLKGGRKSAARNRGTFSGGPGVLGYRPVGSKTDPGKGTLSPIAEEAEAVRLIFAMREQGKTLQAIADALNDAGYLTVRGNSFTTVQVHRVLNREAFYRSETVLVRSHGSTIAAHEPILE